jgi:hypothetical protein
LKAKVQQTRSGELEVEKRNQTLPEKITNIAETPVQFSQMMGSTNLANSNLKKKTKLLHPEVISNSSQQEPRKSTSSKKESPIAVNKNQARQVEDVKKKAKKKNEEEMKLQSEEAVSKKLKMEKAEVR